MFRLIPFGGAVLLSARSALLLQASAASPSPAAEAPSAAHSLNQAALEAFFAGIIPLQLERSEVAGATVLVTKDGETWLQRGYGFSYMKTKRPVQPVSTMFRLASKSKLSTWTAVMHLAEQAKLDLDVG